MHVQLRKKSMKREILAFVFFLLAAGGLILCCREEEKKTMPLLAQKDGITVLGMVPEKKGEEQVFSRRVLLQGTLLEASPRHPLPADFSSPDTRCVRAQVGSFLPVRDDTALCAEAVYALCAMEMDHALENGILFTNGALSYAQQEEQRRQAFDRYARIKPLAEALTLAQNAVPGGGESEHQTGYALDVQLTGPLDLSENNPLQRNETGQWMAENMWRYGWIQRYDPRKENAGDCENIHIRYVGQAHAAAMHALNLELEEYLALLRLKGGLILEKDGRLWVSISCVPCQDHLIFPVPKNAVFQVSADNTGYAVIAVEEKQ